MTIERGERIGWVAGPNAHTVTAYEDRIPAEAEYWASGGWDSEELARSDGGRDNMEAQKRSNIEEGEWYVHQFWVPGTHEYFCIPHESRDMVGTVEVVDPD